MSVLPLTITTFCVAVDVAAWWPVVVVSVIGVIGVGFVVMFVRLPGRLCALQESCHWQHAGMRPFARVSSFVRPRFPQLTPEGAIRAQLRNLLLDRAFSGVALSSTVRHSHSMPSASTTSSNATTYHNLVDGHW